MTKNTKSQITIETTLILFGVIVIALLAVFIMMQIVPLTQSSTSIPVHLISLAVNQTSAIAFLSSTISYPKSLSIEYQNITSSNTMVFSFSNCYLTEVKTNNVLSEYVFNSTPSCNFNIFQGTYKILYAFYLNNGVKTSIPVENKIFGFSPINQQYYSTISVSPQIVTYNGVVSVNVETNLINANYSLKANNYPILSCQNANVLIPCNFVANSSIGVYNSIGYYNISATVYNSLFSDTITNYFIVEPN